MPQYGAGQPSQCESWAATQRTNALKVFIACGVVFYLCMMVGSSDFLPVPPQAVLALGFVALAIGFAQVLVRGLGRPISISLDRGVLSFQGARLPDLVLDGATMSLVRWLTPGFLTLYGTTLIIVTGTRTVTIGGCGYTFPNAPSDSEPAEIYLNAEAFGSLLAAIDPAQTLTRSSASGRSDVPGETVIIELVNNVTSARSLLWQLAPWPLTIALEIVLKVADSKLGLSSTPEGNNAVGLASQALPVAGIIATFALAHLARRSGPGRTPSLEVSNRTIGLRSSQPGVPDAVADRAELHLELGTHTLVSRHAASCYPVLVIRGLGPTALSIGVLDPQYLWTMDTPDLPAPAFIIGAADWSMLVRALGLEVPSVIV
jgi:hypothetical protein